MSKQHEDDCPYNYGHNCSCLGVAPTTPQLDSEELRKQTDNILHKFGVLVGLALINPDEAQADANKEIMELITADRAAFADRVLAVVPDLQALLPLYCGHTSDECRCKRQYVIPVEDMTTAITNLVAEERGEK